MAEIVNAFAQYGIAGVTLGVLLYFIVKPTFDSLIEANKHKQQYIEQLVSNHFDHDKERHEELIKALKDIPNHIERAVKTSLSKKR